MIALLSFLLVELPVAHAQLSSVLSPTRIARYETTTSTLHIPVLEVGDSRLWVELRLGLDGLLSVANSGVATGSAPVMSLFDSSSNSVRVPLAAMYTNGVRQTAAGTYRLELGLRSSAQNTSLQILSLKKDVVGNEMVSIASSGDQADGNAQGAPSISADGRYIAFQSNAKSLVPNDRNNDTDIFVRDTLTGFTTLVSISSAGIQADGSSTSPSISADGRYIAFVSDADNLSSNDINYSRDIFVHDRVSRTTRIVSVATGGVRTRFPKYSPAISANGRYVSFASESEDLVKFDTNDEEDIFVHDLQTGVTERVSVSSSGGQGTFRSGLAEVRGRGLSKISADGRYIVFESAANNLVASDTDAFLDIYVHDRQTRKTTQVSITSTGGQSRGADKKSPSISADGRYVVYESSAEDIYPGAKWGSNIFLHDLQSRTTDWISASRTGTYANSSSTAPHISADARYVAFESRASDLVSGDTNNRTDIFVHDTLTSITRRVSNGMTGQTNDVSEAPVLSADGRYVAFESDATNLVDADINNATDVFVRLLE